MALPMCLEDYFDKSYEFVGNEDWSLPSTAYESDLWQIESLQQMKTSLNKVKGQLNGFDLLKWSAHTKSRDPSSFIIPVLKERGPIDLLTQAWCKFYECLNRFSLVPIVALFRNQLTSVHLCEAPGAFVSALNRFLYTNHRRLQWQWLASTLNPYYEGNATSEMIPDDRLIRHTTEHWTFGADETGDLTKYYNHEALVQRAGEDTLLVTADGSVNCMSDPGEQERNVHFLHYCEALTALAVLDVGGTFVLKLFTMFEHMTVCLMYLLACTFEKLCVFKPCSSKSGNSEVYVICLNFKGRNCLSDLWESLVGPYRGRGSTETHAMFPLAEIDPAFVIQLKECCEFFMVHQCRTINENFRCFPGKDACDNVYRTNQLKAEIAEGFVHKMPIALHMPKRRRLIKSCKEQRRNCTDDKWDFKSITVSDSDAYRALLLASSSVLSIKTGEALEKVTTSRFCHRTEIGAPVSVDGDALIQAALTSLSPNYAVIRNSCFEQKLPQHIFQRRFFRTLNEIVVGGECGDVVIVGVPLLTRFLVGLVYIVGLSYESLLVYREGVLVFRKPIETQKQVMHSHLSAIDAAFSNNDLDLERDQFVADVLEVVPGNLILTGGFYEAIRKYNDGIYEQKMLT